ncbi:hypothetical protein [Haliangium sp.]|uniref:hypothetical protein n=1 Tax=Haliangium sp. TaxID=2663208 RepID=UPI003D0CB470
MSYIGKDIIHYGCAAAFDPDELWACMPRHARKNVRKAERAGVLVGRIAGTADELAALRRIWYLPDDPNFPTELGPDDLAFAATLDGDLLGGAILVPVGRHLFLNNLTADARGKALQVQSFLLWRIVNELAGGAWRYLDIGVSYRPNLYRFFCSFATSRYPIIFHPPALRPTIRFAPYHGLIAADALPDDPVAARAFCRGRPYTLVPDIDWARRIARALAAKPDAAEAAPGTVDPIAGGAEAPITDAPIAGAVEVAAPTAADRLELVDLTHLLPIPYGALLVGVALSPETLWERFGCYDFVKTAWLERALAAPAHRPEAVAAARDAVHGRYLAAFGDEDLRIAAADGFITGFRFRHQDAAALAERYRRFGVEVERTGDQLALPCHQHLGDAEVEYVYAIYRGFLNLCSEWTPTHVKGRLKAPGDRTPAGCS